MFIKLVSYLVALMFNLEYSQDVINLLAILSFMELIFIPTLIVLTVGSKKNWF